MLIKQAERSSCLGFTLKQAVVDASQERRDVVKNGLYVQDVLVGDGPVFMMYLESELGRPR